MTEDVKTVLPPKESCDVHLTPSSISRFGSQLSLLCDLHWHHGNRIRQRTRYKPKEKMDSTEKVECLPLFSIHEYWQRIAFFFLFYDMNIVTEDLEMCV